VGALIANGNHLENGACALFVHPLKTKNTCGAIVCINLKSSLQLLMTHVPKNTKIQISPTRLVSKVVRPPLKDPHLQ